MAGDDGSSAGAGGRRGGTEDEVQIQIAGQPPRSSISLYVSLPPSLPLSLLERGLCLVIVIQSEDRREEFRD